MGEFRGNGIDMETKRKVGPEFGCAAVFYLIVFVQIIMSFVVFASKNAEVHDPATGLCPDGYMDAQSCQHSSPTYYLYGGLTSCVKQALCDEIRTCTSGGLRRLAAEDVNMTAFHERLASGELYREIAEETGPASERRLLDRELARRRLSNPNAQSYDGLWDFFEGNVYQPIVILLCAVILGVAWLVFIAKAAKAAVWGSIVFDVVALVAVFIWYWVDFDAKNWACLIMAAIMVIGAVVARQQINQCANIMTKAMEGLSMNKRIFAVSAGVQVVWLGYFALFIASVIAMHFVKTVTLVVDPTYGSMSCEIQAKGWIGNGWTTAVWTICYYWVTFFFNNIILMLITANLTGWYFGQEGYTSFWLKALPWTVFQQGGANAIASAIMGAAQYLLDRVGNKWKLVFSLLGPWNWILLCVAACMQSILEAYTQFALIASTYSGMGFVESAGSSLKLLKDRMGTAVLTNFLGKDVMAWACYMISLAVGFASWAWADELQGWGSTFSYMSASLLVGTIIMFAYLLAYPFITLVIVILIEPYLASICPGGCLEEKARITSILGAFFLSCLTMFILQAVSHIVVSAMNVIFFCYAVEDAAGGKQERFEELYLSIKSTVVTGVVVQGSVPQSQSGVVVGTSVVGTQPARQSQPGAAPTIVIGAVSNNQTYSNEVP